MPGASGTGWVPCNDSTSGQNRGLPNGIRTGTAFLGGLWKPCAQPPLSDFGESDSSRLSRVLAYSSVSPGSTAADAGRAGVLGPRAAWAV